MVGRRRLTARRVFETEAFLTEAMRHPERWARIPILCVGYGVFSLGLADEFRIATHGLDQLKGVFATRSVGRVVEARRNRQAA